MLSQTPLELKLPAAASSLNWGVIIGCEASLKIYEAAARTKQATLIITPDSATALRVQRELNFFKASDKLPIFLFADWEILPYDHFSPHQDIVSARILTLYQLLKQQPLIVIAAINTLLHYISPPTYIQQHSFIFSVGDQLQPEAFRNQLQQAGYYAVSEVIKHGEYAIRGGVIDVFPMGAESPYRFELFDEEIDNIRTFNPETQLTINKVEEVNLLPAHEYPLDEAAISQFRSGFRSAFAVNVLDSPIYQQISAGLTIAGIEYYLPLFFAAPATLFDYLPKQSLLIFVNDCAASANSFRQEVNQRYAQLSHDILRPILPADRILLSQESFAKKYAEFPRIELQNIQQKPFASAGQANQSLVNLKEYLAKTDVKILFTAQSQGHQTLLSEQLRQIDCLPKKINGWDEFLTSNERFNIVATGIEDGMHLPAAKIAVITESELFGSKVQQRQYRKTEKEQTDAVISNLSGLQIGTPVVHLHYGIGRYLGLTPMAVADLAAEYLLLEYADNDKIYVPVANLHLISRYSGADIENAPLHKLGSKQWDKAKRQAIEQIRDVATDLLDVYAQRAAKKGFKFSKPDKDYQSFAETFPFEETPDQQTAIDAVINDMTGEQAMDRLVCGDVGFGKTEVAMRAAFLAVQSNKQVAMLVPTTLLANQHLETFLDRFANWPIKIECLSRFRTSKQQAAIKLGLANGTIDIVIGTHSLLQNNIRFQRLGLLIVDEEHRLGVQHKDKLKSLQTNVDILALTATPIPRTLNMALSNIRDLSIIATPPARRLSIKTYVGERQDGIIREAVLRELLRGGQVFYLHNRIQTIEKATEELRRLLPEAKIQIAHGQMSERLLEKIMVDFYHQRFNLLVCTTIIESGIDIPTANTIIIDRADKFGLAQLHQLRGRVGRSSHQAYAYLLTPPKNLLTNDAERRLEAIAELEDLGAGFTLAVHDLEIRGAGEFLGEEQSGQIQAIGFSLYMELLDQAVRAIKSGKDLMDLLPEAQACEIDLQIPALLPEAYVPDVYTRLTLYKRIASAKNNQALRDLKIELIDRFGLLPEQTQNLFTVTELKLQAQTLNVKEIKKTGKSLKIIFNTGTDINVNSLVKVIQLHPRQYQMQGPTTILLTLTEVTLEQIIKTIEQFFSDIRV